MGREQTANRGCHAAKQTNDTATLQRIARELGQLVGKHLADQPPNGTDQTSGATRRLGVDVESATGTITQTGQTGETVVGHSDHRHEDPVADSEDSLRLGQSHPARHADQDEL